MLYTLTRTIPKEKTGTAIGFYNFCLNIATSIGITYVAIFMETKYLGKNFTGLFSDLVAIQYSNVLLVLAVISLVALVLYWTLIGRREKKDI